MAQKNKPPKEAVIDAAFAQEACTARIEPFQHVDSPLPDPQSALEAYSTLAYARQLGVNHFWVARKNGRASPYWPWRTPGALGRVDDGAVPGCALIYTPYSSLLMAATIVPCATPRATGLVCFSNERTTLVASPPPPSAPPPPTIRVQAAHAMFSNQRVRPLTEAVCRPRQGPAALQKTCATMITSLLPAQHLGGGPVSPLCGKDVGSRISTDVQGGLFCWPSCTAFADTPIETEAKTGCLTFV